MAHHVERYHAHIKTVSRSNGDSAVGCVAYITGQVLKDWETGRWCKRNHDGEVLAWGTVIPEFAPTYLGERADLEKAWNHVQQSEKRVNSQLANHWNVGSHYLLSEEDHIEIGRTIAQRLTDRYQVMVTWGVHKPPPHGNDKNWHIHFCHNMREIGHDGFGAKVRQISAKTSRSIEVNWARQMFADVVNDKLQERGIEERVSPLSYRERGIDKIPTRHLGHQRNQLELRGVETDIGQFNRKARELNTLKAEHAQITAQIYDLDQERERRKAVPETPQQQPVKKYEDLKTPAPTEEEIKRQLERQVLEYQKAEQLEKQFGIPELKAKAQQDAENAKLMKPVREHADKMRERDGEPADSNSRYAQALGDTYNARDPFASLAAAAMQEGRLFMEGQQKLREQEAAAKTHEERILIATRRLIEAHEYMAITHTRLAGISRAITNGDNDGARHDALRASQHKAVALDLREDMPGLRKELAKQAEIKKDNERARLSQDKPMGQKVERGPQHTSNPSHLMTANERKGREEIAACAAAASSRDGLNVDQPPENGAKSTVERGIEKDKVGKEEVMTRYGPVTVPHNPRGKEGQTNGRTGAGGG